MSEVKAKRVEIYEVHQDDGNGLFFGRVYPVIDRGRRRRVEILTDIFVSDHGTSADEVHADIKGKYPNAHFNKDAA